MAEKYTTKQVIKAIKQAEGNVTATSKILKCTPATTRRYIKKYPAVKKARNAFPKKKAAGKEKYTHKRVIEAITDAKGLLTVAARRLGCSRQTVYNYMEKHEAIREAYNDANESNIDFVENKLMMAINNDNTTAIIFFLKTKGKDRGYVERREIASLEKSIDLDKLSYDQLERLAGGEGILQVLAG